MTRCEGWEEPVLSSATANSGVWSSFVPLQHSWRRWKPEPFPDNPCTGFGMKAEEFPAPRRWSSSAGFVTHRSLVDYTAKILHSDFKAAGILPRLPVKHWAIIWFPCKICIKIPKSSPRPRPSEKGECRGTRSWSPDLLGEDLGGKKKQP